jgi:peptidyl-prolyl cis-trans isomerase C
MQRVYTILAVAVLLVLSTAFASAQGSPDDVVVVVNGEPISTWELGFLLPQIQAELESQGVEPKGGIVVKTTLGRAIDSLLLAQEARRRGIEPDETRINEKMKTMADRAGGRAALEAEFIKSGINYEQVRATVVQADLVQSLVESTITPGIEVSENDVETFYTENPGLFKSPDKIHSRHILIKVAAGDTSDQRATARTRAEEARQRAVAGEDFAALAVELSGGPNAARGGDLGFTARGQMVEDFDDAVWALEPGEISDVVESDLGYHVIKVEEIVPGSTVPLDEARPLIEDLLRQQITSASLGSLVTELRASAEIVEPES